MTLEKKTGILKVLDHGEVIDTFPLMRINTIIGRDSGDLCLEDAEVSGQHCKITYTKGHYYLIDLGSTNGTFVNGGKISKHMLVPNDLLQIGKIEFSFDYDETLLWDPPEELSTPSERGEFSPDLESILNLISKEKKKISSRNTILLELMYQDGFKEAINMKLRSAELGRISPISRFSHDEELSRRHLKIWIGDEGGILICDQKSMNGTFVNGERIFKNTQIYNTDEIKIGRVHMRITLKMNQSQ